jgi:hypothetical protein
MRNWLIAAAAVLAWAGTAAAQQPFVFKPIDTEKFVIRPTNTVANATGTTTAGTIRTIGNAVANVIEDNGFVRTFNNLLGRRATPPTSQAGFSTLPNTSSFQSTKYPNTFTPRMPIGSTYGRSVVFPAEK